MQRRRSGRLTGMVAVAAVMIVVGCAPAPPGGPGGPGGGTRYVDEVFASVDMTSSVTYVAGRPDLVSGQPVTSALDVFRPAGDTVDMRPAIVWIHGGGFRAGTRNSTIDVATAYARRGYVTASIDYRLDPGSRCQDVQDGRIPPDEVVVETARCFAAVDAAQDDAAEAVGWIRERAAELGVDPERIAVGGFSAGAVTAVHVAQRLNGDGGLIDPRTKVALALAASGCNYFPATIDASDPPVSLLASRYDRAVPFDCAVDVANRMEAFGTPVQRIFYFDEGLHAAKLYEAHRADVDAAWTGFLVEHLQLTS